MADRRPADWRTMLSETLDGGETTVQSMLAEAGGDPAAEEEAAGERLLIRAAQAGNPLTPEQVARVRRAAGQRAVVGAETPEWRRLVEAAPSMLTEAA